VWQSASCRQPARAVESQRTGHSTEAMIQRNGHSTWLTPAVQEDEVQTRREAVILMTAIPLLSTDAVAQPDRLDALFNRPAENLSVPSRVRQRYAILAYYIQLLNLQRPIRLRSEDIAAAIKTYQLVGESIARSDARFEGEVQASFVESLRQAFSKSEEELWAFLREVGIDPRLLAARVIEEALASNMLFYGAETRVANVTDMLWCCFPFCFRRPT
jgi:hypothetical protein